MKPNQEEKKIIKFIKEILEKTGKDKVIIGLSGGIDSTVSFFLLKKALPLENIIAVHLPYLEKDGHIEKIIKDFPKENFKIISIKQSVGITAKVISRDTRGTPGTLDTLRLGNIIARTRMIFLYDLAKKHNALVCGTENKSEHYLGYFTRFGDEASDFEPIRHLYKTQVFELAKYLGVPRQVIEKTPTAGLWENQTDENELGFTYKEADQVLQLYFEKKNSVEQTLKMGFKNAEKIVKRALENEFKHETPYSLFKV